MRIILKIFIFVFASIVAMWVVATSNANGPQSQPAEEINLSKAAFDANRQKPIVIYVQQVRVDNHGFGVCAQGLVERLFKERPAADVAIVLWPNDSREKVEVWAGDSAKHIAGHLNEHLNGESGTPDPAGFTSGLNYCCDLAKEMKGDVVILSTDYGIGDLTERQKKDLLAASTSKRCVIHVMWMFGSDPKQILPLVNGEVIVFNFGDADVKRR